jgi:arabinofuranan 3-O-arabinosyltransferase
VPVRRLIHFGRRGHGWTIAPILSACAFALAFVQRPGKTFADARVELTANPGLFMHQVSQLWSSTTDLGHVASAQFVGYLFPMAPWFAFAHAIGMPMWVAERIWMGSLLAIAAWGVVKLMDELYSPRRGAAHVVAAVLFAVNPYVATFDSRSAALLSYAAMPWLMIAAHRGLRRPRGWVWPVFVAFALAASGGGVNAAYLPWVVAGPALLVLYEWLVLERKAADVGSFAWRTAVCSFVASAWWIIPVGLQSRYGSDFLAFLEQPAIVWSTSSMSESLRLLGYWIFYFGTGYHTVAEASIPFASPYLFNPAIIVGTFAVPLLAAAGLTWNRSWRYAPFFGLLAVFGVLAMSIGFPEGKPLERWLVNAYYDVGSLQFMRTTYKAAPNVALGFACLVGAGAAALYSSARSGGLRVVGARVPAWSLAPLLLVPLAYGFPYFEGKAIDSRLTYEVPSYWRQALAHADSTTPPNQRVMVLPGQLFSWYRWGETNTSIATAISKRPVLIRQASLYADPRSSQLLTATDDLVQQARLVPGQLPSLLGLMGVGEVLVPTDGVPGQTGEPDPATAARALRADFPPGGADARFGTTRTYLPALGHGGSPVQLPDIRSYRVPNSRSGIVRVQPTGGATLLDGDAEGVAELAAAQALDSSHALFYAGDLDRTALSDQVKTGATLVFSDSNRRRYVSGSLSTHNKSATQGPDDPIPPSLPTYDLFPSRGSDDQTVALYPGLSFLRTPLILGPTPEPENRPYAAFDGSLKTAWLASSPNPAQRYIELGFQKPRSIGALRVHAHNDPDGGTTKMGVSVNGGAERAYVLRAGWTDVPLQATGVRTLRLRVAGVAFGGGLGGFDEVQIAGLQLGETLRLPRLLARETSGMDLSHNPMEVLLQRTTADFPYRSGADVEAPQSGNPLDEVDPEPGLERDVMLPAARTFTLSGWASQDPSSSDVPFDRLAGVPTGWNFRSSSRFEGWPIHRASSALDGNSKTGWIGDFVRQQFAWISLSAPHSFDVRTFKLSPLSSDFFFPSRLEVTASNGYRVTLPVADDGTVTLPKRIRTTSLRLDIVAVRGSTKGRLLRAVAISEIQIPGLNPPAPRRTGNFATRCGQLSVAAGTQHATAQVSGTLQQLDAGLPLSLRGCGNASTLSLSAGTNHISATPGSFMQPDHLRLSSSAPAPLPVSTPTATVVNPGGGGDGTRTGVRLNMPQASWLVLAESYSRGWQAWCTPRSGRETSLGRPVAIDGFANGWRAPAGCTAARFDFTPQRTANAAYAFSAMGAGVMLLLLAAGALLRRRRPALVAAADPPAWVAAPADPVRRLNLPVAVGIGVAAGVAGGVLFALRAGVAIGLATAVLLFLGITARRLLALAIAGLAAVMFVYVVSPSPDSGGFYFYYAIHYMTAHWIALGVVCAFGVAAGLMAWDVRASDAGGSPRRSLGPLLRRLNVGRRRSARR